MQASKVESADTKFNMERFDLLEVLRSNNSTSIVLVEDAVLREKVVLKILGATLATDRVAFERFKSSYLSMQQVNDPHVLKVHDFVESEGSFAIVMEHAENSDLESFICRQSDNLIFEELHDMLMQIARGLQAIHGHGMVHRDLKPSNILIDASGTIKLGDFSVARLPSKSRLTLENCVVGTPDYLAPEYLLTGECDARADIYSFGMVAYELVAGQKPFDDGSPYSNMLKKLEIDPVAPSTWGMGICRAFDSLILKCLDRDPQKRFQSAGDLLTALEGLKNKEEINSLLSDSRPEPMVLGNVTIFEGSVDSVALKIEKADFRRQLAALDELAAEMNTEMNTGVPQEAEAPANSRRRLYATKACLVLGIILFAIFTR